MITTTTSSSISVNAVRVRDIGGNGSGPDNRRVGRQGNGGGYLQRTGAACPLQASLVPR